MGSRSWSTPAPTATTVKRHSGVTSVRRSATTRSSSEASTSPSRADLSCGSDTLGRTGSELEYDPHGNILRWSAEHDGYEALDPPATHRRTVSLDEAGRRVEISDEIDTSGPQVARMAFHLGPEVSCRLDENCAWLSWPAGDGTELEDPKLDGPKLSSALLELPGELSWSVHRGELEPVLGWYSSSFGRIEPTTVVMGERAAPRENGASHLASTFSQRAGEVRSS